MYVIPFSMGPVGSNLSKIGVQLTDSPYVAASMKIMTRMGSDVLQALGDDDFVRYDMFCKYSKNINYTFYFHFSGVYIPLANRFQWPNHQ